MAELKELTSKAQVDELLNSDEPVWVYKHSETCPISASAQKHVRAYLENHDPEVAAGQVTVQRHRELSDYIADETGVKHETPQALLVEGRQVLWHGSHRTITGDQLREARAKASSSNRAE
jgi:bacillithiol system protein YtxJ